MIRPRAEPTTPKNWNYYTGANDHLLAELPSEAGVVLDVGCAAGALGRAIKERHPEAIVDGIDFAPDAVAEAKQHLDRVHQLDLNADERPNLDRTYDCIYCGDVLEHLIDPWQVLRWLVSFLAPNGVLVASIPNLRYYKVLRSLVIRGRFTYRESGILDSTHLRFFTLHEMKKLFESAGLEVTHQRPRIGGGNKLIRFLDWVSRGGFEELRAMQYTLVGRRLAVEGNEDLPLATNATDRKE